MSKESDKNPDYQKKQDERLIKFLQGLLQVQCESEKILRGDIKVTDPAVAYMMTKGNERMIEELESQNLNLALNLRKDMETALANENLPEEVKENLRKEIARIVRDLGILNISEESGEC